MTKKKILLTAFAPFGGESINPSQILLEKLQQDSFFSGEATFLSLPVVFDEASSLVTTAMLHNTFDFVIMLGQAGGRKTVCLERVALNWVDAKADEKACRPAAGKIQPGASEAFISDLDLDGACKALRSEGLGVSVSLSAGAYVCNYVYFKAAELLQKQGGGKSLFVHLPYLPEQVVDKSHQPAMGLDEMEKALKGLIRYLLAVK